MSRIVVAPYSGVGWPSVNTATEKVTPRRSRRTICNSDWPRLVGIQPSLKKGCQPKRTATCGIPQPR